MTVVALLSDVRMALRADIFLSGVYRVQTPNFDVFFC